MFKIVINDHNMVPVKKFETQLLNRSPLFNELGSRLLNMSFSGKSLGNKKAFNFPARMHKHEVSKHEFDGFVEIGPFKQVGKFSVGEAGDDVIETTMYFNKGNFNDSVEGKSLRDIAYPTFNIGSSAQQIADYANANIDKQYPDVAFNFPMIYAPEFYGKDQEGNPDFLNYLNYYDLDDGIIINELEEGLAVNKYSLVPNFFSWWILEQICEHFGYTFLKSNLNKHSEYKQLIEINSYALDKFANGYYVKAGMSLIQNITGTATAKIDDDSSGDFEDEDNVFSTSIYKYTISQEGIHKLRFDFDHWSYAQASDYPEVTVSFFKDDVQVYTKDFFENSMHWVTDFIEVQLNFGAADINKLLRVEVEFFDETNGTSSQGRIRNGIFEVGGVGDLNVYDGNINPVNHLPDLSVKEFIKNLEICCGCKLIVDDNKKCIYPVFWEDFLNKTEYIDWSAGIVAGSKKVDYSGRITKFKIGYSDQQPTLTKHNRLADVNRYSDLPANTTFEDICLVKTTNSIYIYRELDGEDPEGWYFFCKNIYDYETGEGDNSEELTINFNIMKMEASSIRPVPQLEGEGTSTTFGVENKDFEQSVLFYRGLKKDFYNLDYPLATSLKIGIDLSLIGEHSLLPKDIADKSYFSKIQWLLNSRLPVSYTKNFTLEELAVILYERKYRIYGVNYLVDVIDQGVKTNKLTKATLKLYSV